MDSETEVIHDDVNASAASLGHARTMLIHFAEQRIKNFNFFLIVSGVLIASYAKNYSEGGNYLIAIAGIVISLLFLLLDFRTLQLIKDARNDLEVFEKRFGLTIHAVDQLPDKSRKKGGSGRSRFRSHTFVYRTVFILMTLLSIIILINRIRGSEV